MSDPITIKLGPDIVLTNSSGSTTLSPISNLTLSVTPVASTQEATGNATITNGTLNLSLSIPKGSDGTTPTFEIGSVTAAAAGSQPSATLVPSDTVPNEYLLNLTLVNGADGTGNSGSATAPVFSVGTVSAASSPTVTLNKQTDGSYQFDFGLVAGATPTLKAGTITALDPAATPTFDLTNNNDGSYTLDLGVPKGTAGTNGVAPTLTVGTVTTLNAGSSATFELVPAADGSAKYIVNVGIPQGAAGTGGTGTGGTTVAPTVKIGTVAVGATADAAAVTTVTSSDGQTVTLNFVLPPPTNGTPGTTPVLQTGTTTLAAAGVAPSVSLTPVDGSANTYALNAVLPAPVTTATAAYADIGAPKATATVTGTTVAVDVQIPHNPYEVFFNWKPETQLKNFRLARLNVAAGTADARCRITTMTDSTGVGVDATPTNYRNHSWPYHLTKILNQKIPATYDSFFGSGNASNGTGTDADSRITLGGSPVAVWSGANGAGGPCIELLTGSTVTFTPDASDTIYDSVDVHVINTGSTAAGSYSVSVDGTVIGTSAADTGSGSGIQTFSFLGGSVGKVVITGVSADNKIYLEGVTLWNSTNPMIEVYNCGVDGAHAADFLGKATDGYGIGNGALATQPQLAIIDLGINDMAYPATSSGPNGTFDAPTVAATLSTIIDNLQEQNTDVILCVPQITTYGDQPANTNALRDQLYAVALAKNVGVIDLSNYYGNDAANLTGLIDVLHYHETVYADMAALFAQAIFPPAYGVSETYLKQLIADNTSSSNNTTPTTTGDVVSTIAVTDTYTPTLPTKGKRIDLVPVSQNVTVDLPVAGTADRTGRYIQVFMNLMGNYTITLPGTDKVKWENGVVPTTPSVSGATFAFLLFTPDNGKTVYGRVGY